MPYNYKEELNILLIEVFLFYFVDENLFCTSNNPFILFESKGTPEATVIN